LLDEQQRGAIRAAAENIPGVKAVEDHLVWVDPVSGVAIHAFEEEAERTAGCLTPIEIDKALCLSAARPSSNCKSV